MVNLNENEAPIPLLNSVNQLMNTVNPDITLYDIIEHNKRHLTTHECEAVYLHILIIFKDANKVDMFLQDYSNRYGIYATNMFVNYPLVDIHNRCNMTPLDCALLWNHDVNKVRLLYRWGANVSVPNVDGNYINIGNLPPYRNYLSSYTLRENIYPGAHPIIKGLRVENEFLEIIREMDYICGEDNPPQGWVMPARIN